MRIADHRLIAEFGETVSFVPSSNREPGNTPKLIVAHFTVGTTLPGVVERFRDPTARVSAHGVIGPDGEVVQMVLFDHIAWHAGESAWEGRRGVNRFSIGLELVNAGRVQKTAGGVWINALGERVPEEEIIPGDAEASDVGWHRYPDRQIEFCIRIARCLVAAYGCEAMVGHEHVSPGRKQDPGPAFPWRRIRAAVFE